MRREVSHHLRDHPMPDRDNGRLQNELGWQDDRGNLLRFLDGPAIEPTNNRAERALRGAVPALDSDRGIARRYRTAPGMKLVRMRSVRSPV